MASPSDRPAARRGPIAVLVLLFLAVGIAVAGVRNVSGGNVGVSVNNLTGTIRLEEREGLHFTIPYVITFYVLDRRSKSLEMLASPETPPGAKERPPEDSVNLKSSEGDAVRVDVKVSYRILASKAVAALQATGADSLATNGVETKWVRPLVRAAVADRFNALTREDMNDGEKRRTQAELARQDVNGELTERFGIEVLLITVERPSSYQQYEDLVDQRKKTDQRVEGLKAEQAQEVEAQKKAVKEETNKKEQQLSAAVASAERFLQEARAQAREIELNAEAASKTKHADADGKLEESKALARGKRAQGEADAEATRQQAEALAGPAGFFLVCAEYSKRMKEMTVNAMPFVYSGVVQPYLLQQGASQGIPLPMEAPKPPAPSPGGPR
jgi:regulator of protease activity HflC (stomatin/prohibitin superfamily)